MGAQGVQYVVKFFLHLLAVAKYIVEANIEAKSGWPLPKPSTNYPVLSTVLEGYIQLHTMATVQTPQY